MSLRPDAIPWNPVAGENNNANANANPNIRRGPPRNNNVNAPPGADGNNSGGPTTEAKLFVGQIPYECDSERLRELFEAYGNVKGIHILADGGGPRGGGRGGAPPAAAAAQQTKALTQQQINKGRAAFITYSNTDEADCAIFTLHNRYRMLTNRPIQVSYAKNSPNISAFGRQAAIEVANANRSNPMPM